jgi:phage regulator Rha-like protein
MAKKQQPPALTDQLPVPVETITRRIYLIRGQKVMLDSDLAELYQVLTKNLNKAVRRNTDRFPADFMFQLTQEEAESLRFQIGTSNEGRGGRRYLPYAFTEHGVAMLSSVLNSKRAVQMNILIIRAFVQLRELLASHKDLAQKIELMETTQKRHAGALRQQADILQQHDAILVGVVKDIQRIKNPPITRAIGFYDRSAERPKKKSNPRL